MVCIETVALGPFAKVTSCDLVDAAEGFAAGVDGLALQQEVDSY